MSYLPFSAGTQLRRRRPFLRGHRFRSVSALFLLITLLVASCQPYPDRPSDGLPVGSGPAPAGGAPAANAVNVAAPSAAGAGTAAANTQVSLVDVPILGNDLAAGWDAGHSWNVQFAKGQDQAANGATAWNAKLTQDAGGIFLAVKQDSPNRYLRANYLGARLWINPGAQDLVTDRISVAVLSNDLHAYWAQADQAVPPQDPGAVGEATIRPAGQKLPAGAWTELQVWFSKLPSPPRGRYLTGLYLRISGVNGQAVQLAGLDLLAIPDNVQPAPVAVSVVDLDSLRVSFNEDVDPATAENPQNYRITSKADPAYSSPQAPGSVQYLPDSTSALLKAPKTLRPGVDYTVQVAGIADFAPQPHVQAAAAQLVFTANALVVTVDAAHPSHPISPLIYGIAGGTPDYLKALRPTLENWGGNPNSTYNWQLGNAWNAASDWEYRNGNYGNKPGQSASDQFISDAQTVGSEVRMTLPTLGWVAKNDDTNTCSFVGADGKCYNPGANCAKPGPTADPNRAYVPSDVNSVVQWVKNMIDAKGFKVRFFAFDNEPDLWGYTHYDVHPNCTGYDEILQKYLQYATAVRAVAPQAELLGPVSCCWNFYWNSAIGQTDKAAHGNQDFLPWFLSQVRQHDQQSNVRTLDALDIHYYPEGVYNDKADPATAQARLQETRSLWDKSFTDPSWIAQPVNLIPRMNQVIADNYPGTKLFISEWNFGADKTMNGALAIADVLGIYGEQGLYAASYWRNPDLNSPGFFGFKMYTNFDDNGGRFGDTALPVTSSNRDQVAAYASRDSATGNTLLMLINKLPDKPMPVTLKLDGITNTKAQMYRYSQDHLDGIVQQSADLSQSAVTLPPYSITLLVMAH